MVVVPKPTSFTELNGRPIDHFSATIHPILWHMFLLWSGYQSGSGNGRFRFALSFDFPMLLIIIEPCKSWLSLVMRIFLSLAISLHVLESTAHNLRGNRVTRQTEY